MHMMTWQVLVFKHLRCYTRPRRMAFSSSGPAQESKLNRLEHSLQALAAFGPSFRPEHSLQALAAFRPIFPTGAPQAHANSEWPLRSEHWLQAPAAFTRPPLGKLDPRTVSNLDPVSPTGVHRKPCSSLFFDWRAKTD